MRLRTIDGLRGIAAILVVFFHLYVNLKTSVEEWFPQLLATIFLNGHLGVHIFFVISGYVIALSIDGRRIGFGFLGRFALRRAIRLDPPYWLSIFLAVSLSALSAHIFPELTAKYPSIKQVLAHLFYLQNLFGYGDIVAVYWTLCLEVQFYLVFVSLAVIVQRYTKAGIPESSGHANILFWVCVVLGLLSLESNYHVVSNIRFNGLFLPYWYEFFLGVLVYWVNQRTVGSVQLLVCLSVVLLLGIYHLDLNALTCLGTAAFLYYAGHANKLDTYLTSRMFQYLGMISYSLYLLHPIVGWRIISVGKKLIGSELGIAYGLFVFTAGVIGSVIAAHIAYRVIERPSMKLAHKIRLA